jgi:hypothetical protein
MNADVFAFVALEGYAVLSVVLLLAVLRRLAAQQPESD